MDVIQGDEVGEKSQVASWYAGKSIFITGATGFMGKVLVEKLLRSCPDVKNLYLMIRPKRGQTAEARKDQYLKCVVNIWLLKLISTIEKNLVRILSLLLIFNNLI